MSTMRPEKPETASLYYAVRLGFLDLAEHLIIERPEHVGAMGGSKRTPMHAAASEGQTDILSLLIQHGADVNDRRIAFGTPLCLAAGSAKLEAGQILLKHGVDVDGCDGSNNTALIYAIISRDIEFARMLLERGAMIDARCNSRAGWTALHWAAYRGRTEFVRLFLEHGADVNARNVFGDTPFKLASRRGHHEVAELLTEYRVNNVIK
jgi:ankyrin repeat protein